MEIPRRMSNERSKVFAAILLAERERAVVDGRLFGLHNQLKGMDDVDQDSGS
jgi:hypothetical protein